MFRLQTLDWSEPEVHTHNITIDISAVVARSKRRWLRASAVAMVFVAIASFFFGMMTGATALTSKSHADDVRMLNECDKERSILTKENEKLHHTLFTRDMVLNRM